MPADKTDRTPRRLHDAPRDPNRTCIRYRVPDIGVIQFDYTGDYTRDRKYCQLDPGKFAVKTYFNTDDDIAVKPFEWALHCVPNPNGKAVLPWQMEDFLTSIKTIQELMPDLQALADKHFPEEARK